MFPLAACTGGFFNQYGKRLPSTKDSEAVFLMEVTTMDEGPSADDIQNYQLDRVVDCDDVFFLSSLRWTSYYPRAR